MAIGRRVETLPERYDGEVSEHARKIAQTVNGILKGQQNNYYTVTLPAGEGSIEQLVEYARVGMVGFTAPAGSAAVGSSAWVDVQQGKFVLESASSEVDRTFAVLLVG